MKHKLFVYGTLKKGHRLSTLLDKSKFIKKYKTEVPFIMTSISDAYPMIFENYEHGKSIKGELYEITDKQLEVVDAVELGAGYYRKRIEDDINIYVSPTLIGMRESEHIIKTKNTFEWI